MLKYYRIISQESDGLNTHYYIFITDESSAFVKRKKESLVSLMFFSEIIEKVKRPPPLIRPSVSKGAAPPEAINIMRQCWAEQAEMRPDFNTVHDQFKKLNHGRKVNIVDTMFQMLEKYSNNLEELIRERTEQLDIEKKKTEQLLNRMLPRYFGKFFKILKYWCQKVGSIFRCRLNFATPVSGTFVATKVFIKFFD
jgi:hypothetical protein